MYGVFGTLLGNPAFGCCFPGSSCFKSSTASVTRVGALQLRAVSLVRVARGPTRHRHDFPFAGFLRPNYHCCAPCLPRTLPVPTCRCCSYTAPSIHRTATTHALFGFYHRVVVDRGTDAGVFLMLCGGWGANVAGMTWLRGTFHFGPEDLDTSGLSARTRVHAGCLSSYHGALHLILRTSCLLVAVPKFVA